MLVARWEECATPVTTKWFVCKYSAHCGSTRVVQGLVDSLVLLVKKKKGKRGYTLPLQFLVLLEFVYRYCENMSC